MTTQKATILVVDDQPANLKVLLSFLKDHQFQIRIAEDGERTLQVLENYKPDIILLDVMMPGMNGFETCRRIKEKQETADIPIIFITALDNIEDKIAGFEAGGVDYITKPFQQVEVLTRIKTHIRLRRKEQELEKALDEVIRQQKLFKKLSITDDLTGLYNRRHLNNILQQEFQRSKRHKNDLSCLMLDLDHFKQVNDTYGHDFGDTVLRVFAFILKEFIRSSDYAFRYGGEEFLLLLPETDIKGALQVGEKIRLHMANEKITENTISTTVMVSVGASSVHSNEPSASDDLITFADKALYEAKMNGRNQVRVYGQNA
ncbi:MAG: diguanylate cyclase [Thermodesulfobacteriota bacterium]|nr:diguanylate cyclase [Thermodesulfobacteriota bacterium]